MEVVHGYPPNIEKIYDRFPDVRGKNAVFAYGNKIYNPGRDAVSKDVMVHEEVHEKQQAAHKGGVEGWWQQYLDDAPFRLQQELEAYAAQFRWYSMAATRRKSDAFLYRIASDLAHMYGLKISVGEAESRIRKLAMNV